MAASGIVPSDSLAGRVRTVKRATAVACLTPAIVFVVQALVGDFGWNPSRAMMDSLGRWAIRLFLLTMAIGPLHRLTGWAPWLAARRWLGVATFGYAAAHVGVYLGLELQFDWATLIDDLIERGAILVGLIALVLMTPLAITSNAAAIARLGGRTWRALHWLVYPAFAHAVYHFGLMVGRDKREALAYAGIALALLGIRLGAWAARRRRRATSATASHARPSPA